MPQSVLQERHRPLAQALAMASKSASHSPSEMVAQPPSAANAWFRVYRDCPERKGRASLSLPIFLLPEASPAYGVLRRIFQDPNVYSSRRAAFLPAALPPNSPPATPALLAYPWRSHCPRLAPLLAQLPRFPADVPSTDPGLPASRVHTRLDCRPLPPPPCGR